MGYIVYIGAALIVGLLIGFIALSVIMLRRSVLHNVRSHTLRLISLMDKLLEEKSDELKWLEAELEEKENMAAQAQHKQEQTPQPTKPEPVSPAQMLALVESTGAGSYRDSAVADTYRLIRDNFAFRPEEIIARAARLSEKRPAGEAPEELSYSAVFELSTLPEQQQLELLQESLSPDGLALLEEYLSRGVQFNIFAFYDSLKSRRAERMQGVRLLFPAALALPALGGAAFSPEGDGSICEGFQLESGGRLYDYCIKTKELN